MFIINLLRKLLAIKIKNTTRNRQFSMEIPENKNVLLHGPGGCGKSYCLRQFAAAAKGSGKVIAITATTGVAALSLHDAENKIVARTLHSWAGIGLGTDKKERLVIKIKSKKIYRERWITTSILIIDEVSMLGAKLFDKLDYIGRKVRKNDVPFGGLQIILSGDFFQLPPVKEDWIFESDVWFELELENIVLKECKRFEDVKYFQLLNRIRLGEPTKEDVMLLKTRYQEYKELKKRTEEDVFEVRPTFLYATKVDVTMYNVSELDKLETKSVEFIATDFFEPYTRHYKKYNYEPRLDDGIPKRITLKEGAQVMLKVNLDVKSGYVNGSRGVITKITYPDVVVKFIDDEELVIGLHVWKIEDDNGAGLRSQIPLILAYSNTIHKCQGLTLDYAVVDLGPTVFACGQAYVALSRVRSISGLFLSEFYAKSIRTDQFVKEFVEEEIEN